MKNTYWNHRGLYQARYEEMYEAVEKGLFKWLKGTSQLLWKYYRWYNDGDLPFRKDNYELVRPTYKYSRYSGKSYCYYVLTDAGTQELENRINKAFEKEWNRYLKVRG